MKNYKIGFDVGALIVFLIIMIPNILWMLVPSQNDVLRSQSITPVVDMAASVSQIVMIVMLCFLKNVQGSSLKVFLILTAIAVIFYLSLWVLYYSGIVYSPILMGLSVFPCLAFLTYSLYRKNYITIIPLSVFTVCHIIFVVVNFMN